MSITRNIIVLVWLLLQYGSSHAQYDKNWVFGTGCHLIFEEDTVLQKLIDANYNPNDELSISDENGNLKAFIKTTASNTGTPVGIDGYTAYLQVVNNDSVKKSVELDFTYNRFYFNTLVLKDKVVILYKKQSAQCFLDYNTVSFNSCPTIKQKAVYFNLDNDTVVPFFELPDSVVFNSDVVKHANGKDWWLIGHIHPLSGGGLSNNTFYRVLIKEDGSIEGPFYQNIGTRWRKNGDVLGPIKFSRNGKFLAIGLLRPAFIEVFDFDRCTGLLSNTKIVDFGGVIVPHDFEFSQNDNFLYVTQNNIYSLIGLSDNTAVYQYDLSATSTNYNKTTLLLRNYLTNGTFTELSYANNNKIYITNRVNSFPDINFFDTTHIYTSLSVIKNPDSAGLACGFEEFSFQLRDSCYASFGLPNFPNFNIETLSIYEAEAGRDTVICTDSTINQKVVGLGNPKVNGVQYQWYPNYNLSSDSTAQVLAYPDSTTMYYVMLSDTSIKNACKTRLDSVLVEVKNCVTGIDDPHTPKGGLRVYPNPAIDEVKIEIQNSKYKIQDVKVYDVAGRAIIYNTKQAKGQYYTLDIATVTSGLYFVEVILGNGSVERVKFTKQ